MDVDQPTLIAYRAYIQHQIRSDLNGVGLGPGKSPFYLAVGCIILAFLFGIVGVLIITLRFRHVYLVSWNDQFLGPAFIVIFLILMTAATYLIIVAKRRSNRFRRELYFRPIGDYGIGVIHKSMISREQEHKSELKSGTTPHKKIMPRGEMYSHDGGKKDYHRGHENRAYDQERDDHHRRRPRDDDRRRRPDDADRRRRHEGDDRRPREGGDRRHEGGDRRPREGDDRHRYDEERRRHEEKRRYEEDRRRRAEMKRREAEEGGPPPGDGPPPADGPPPVDDRVKGRRPPKFIKPSSHGPIVVLDENFGMRTGHVDSESEL